jgi:peptidyl-prolyl cis-trans isomerase B (cyclophilin B)
VHGSRRDLGAGTRDERRHLSEYARAKPAPQPVPAPVIGVKNFRDGPRRPFRATPRDPGSRRRDGKERFTMRRILTITGATVVLGLTGLVASAVTQAAPQHPGPLRQHAARVTVRPGTARPTAVARAGTAPNSCGFVRAIPADDFKGLPNYTAARAAHPFIVRMFTTQGLIVWRALTSAAPCTTYSFRFLAERGYFTWTHCHRLTVRGIYVLQCGDPTGTGSGGPGYKFNDENLAGASYPAGTVAMANAGPDTNGSQFFFCWKNSSLIPPDYTPFGTVIQGMNVLRRIAAAGDDSQNGPGDGYPHLFTAFTYVQIVFTK